MTPPISSTIITHFAAASSPTYTCEKLATNTGVFDTDSSGNPISNIPAFIEDDSGNNAFEGGFYLQDEWTHHAPAHAQLRLPLRSF